MEPSWTNTSDLYPPVLSSSLKPYWFLLSISSCESEQNAALWARFTRSLADAECSRDELRCSCWNAVFVVARGPSTLLNHTSALREMCDKYRVNNRSHQKQCAPTAVKVIHFSCLCSSTDLNSCVNVKIPRLERTWVAHESITREEKREATRT